MIKYLIKKGKHYHSNWIERIRRPFAKKRSQQYIVTLSRDCWYKYENKDSKDYNKLFGIGWLNPKVASARFAWKPDFKHYGMINLYTYVYSNKTWEAKYITKIKIKEPVALYITSKRNWKFKWFKITGKGSYTFSMRRRGSNDWIRVVDHTDPCGLFRLYPYFGGNNKAPNNMTITMDPTNYFTE